MKRTKNDHGFTLIELIVALAVMAILMVAVMGLMGMNTATNRKMKADISVQSTAQDTYNTITDSVMQAKNIEIEGYTLTADVTFDTHNVGAEAIAGSQKVTYISQDSWEALFKDAFGDAKVEVNGEEVETYKIKMEAYEKGTLSESDQAKVAGKVPENKKFFSSLSTSDKIYVSKMTIQYAVQLDASNVPAGVDTSGLEKDDSGNLKDGNLDTCTVVYEFDKNNMYVTRTYKYMQNLNSTYTGTDDKDKYRYTDALNYVVLGSGDTSKDITGVIATIDAKNNAMGIDLYFADNNMSYTTNGMIKVRNSYVLSQFE